MPILLLSLHCCIILNKRLSRKECSTHHVTWLSSSTLLAGIIQRLILIRQSIYRHTYECVGQITSLLDKQQRRNYWDRVLKQQLTGIQLPTGHFNVHDCMSYRISLTCNIQLLSGLEENRDDSAEELSLLNPHQPAKRRRGNLLKILPSSTKKGQTLHSSDEFITQIMVLVKYLRLLTSIMLLACELFHLTATNCYTKKNSAHHHKIHAIQDNHHICYL